MHITHVSICQYDKYHSKKLCSTIYVYGSYHLSVWEVPWNCDDISNPYYRGHQNTSDGSRNMDKTLPPFGVTSAKPFPPKIGQLKPSKIVEIWTLHMYLFACTEVIICKPDMSPET